MSIYVETRIHARMEDLWKLTQHPDLHEQWDLRFSHINYLPRASGENQRFRYETRIGFGLHIRGEGESAESHDESTGQRTSALRFWSGDSLSLISEGSGYWKYLPTDDGIRFLTWYDYRTRYGLFGRLANAIFQPLMGWATAWSFDRLRLWAEKGIHPAISMQRSLIHAASRVALIIVFLYQGLVPKLIVRHSSELALLSDAGLNSAAAARVLTAIGFAEIALALVLLVAWAEQWPLTVVLVLMAISLAGVSIFSPHALVGAFNPVALNVAVASLAAIAWLSALDLPSAGRCLRTRPAQSKSGAA